MHVVDAPQAIARRRLRFAVEGRTRLQEVVVPLEPAHERAVDGQRERLAHPQPSIQVPVSRRSAAGSACGDVITPAPPAGARGT